MKRQKMKKLLQKMGSFILIGIFSFASLGFGNISRAANINKQSKNIYAKDNAKLKQVIEQKKLSNNKPEKIEKGKTDFVKDEVLVKFKKDKLNVQQAAGSSSSSGTKMSLQGAPARQAANKSNKNNGSASLEKQVRDFGGKFGLEKKSYVGKQNLAVMKIKDGGKVVDKIRALQNDPTVESVQPNFKYTPAAIDPSNDGEYVNQWGLNNTGQTFSVIDESIGGGTTITTNKEGTVDADIDASEAWAVSEGDNSKIVAVIDTGVAYENPDLSVNMWDGTTCVDENNEAIAGGCPNHGWDFDYDYSDNTDGDNDPSPGHNGLDWWTGGIFYSYSSHGTHVAGIIAGADNATGIVGVAPHAQIMAVKTADLTTDEIVKGIAFAENNGAQIINASWGGYEADQVLEDAIADFDGLFVAAAGNESDSGLIPCALELDNVICVAATDKDDKLADYSNYSETEVDVAAPGSDILSTVGNYNYAYDNFNDLTTPNLPSNLTASGGSNWQSRDVTSVMASGMNNFGSSFKNVIYGDNFGPYADNADTTLTSDSIDFSTAKKADMYFNVACDTQYDTDNWNDYMALEFSKDGGSSWNEISRWDEAALGSELKASYNQGTFYVSDVDSSYFVNNFKYRFRWITNGTDNNYGGCFVDGLWNTVYSKGYPAYEYYSGTSMATPMVAGLVALTWSSKDSLTKEQIKDVILATGDSLDALDGKTVSGKRINAKNAIDTISDVSVPIVNKLGNGEIDYQIADGGDVDLEFSEVLATGNRKTVENAISNELEASAFFGTANFSWNMAGDKLNIAISDGVANFKNDVVATVTDIVGNENIDLILIDSSSDETAPTGKISINKGAASTTSRLVALYQTALDNVGVSQMRFSNNGSKWSTWITYNTKYSNWNFSNSSYGGNTKKGTKYVYVQFRDKAGNISSKYRDSITYK